MAKQVYGGYTLKCDTCGLRSAAWSIDVVSGDNLPKTCIKAFRRQEECVVEPVHSDHAYQYLVKVLNVSSESELKNKLQGEGSK